MFLQPGLLVVLSLYLALSHWDSTFSLKIYPLQSAFSQTSSSEPEGCSPPVSLKIAKRKRQRGERSCLRKAKPRSEEGMSLLCNEACTCELQLGWVGMGQGISLPYPCAHPRANTVSFPTAWHHHPETPKNKILLPSYPHHPKPSASWKSGLWCTQS